MLNRFKGLFRDTWWLWTLFLLLSAVFVTFVDRFFVVTLPILVVAFSYYAVMRYDDNGTHKGDVHTG